MGHTSKASPPLSIGTMPCRSGGLALPVCPTRTVLLSSRLRRASLSLHILIEIAQAWYPVLSCF